MVLNFGVKELTRINNPYLNLNMEVLLSIVQSKIIQNSVRDYFSNLQFEKPVAVTLTLKQGIRIDRGKSSAFTSITPDRASQNLRHFLSLLNSHYHGKKASRHGYRMPTIAVLEGTRSTRLHYHLLVDWPKAEGHEQIAGRVSTLWGKTQWGFSETHVELNADEGWLSYITKLRGKSDFASSIDWENCTLG